MPQLHQNVFPTLPVREYVQSALRQARERYRSQDLSAIVSTRASEVLIAELRAAGVSHIQTSKYLWSADYLWLLPKERSNGEEIRVDQ